MAVQAQFPSLGSQDWMENCCGGLSTFYFDVQQQKQQLQQQLIQQQQQQQCNMQQWQNHQLSKDQNFLFATNLHAPFTFRSNPTNPTNNTCSNSLPSVSFSQTVAALDQKQIQEIDQYIRLQDQRLRLLLHKQRKQQVALLCKNVESKLLPYIKLRDEQIAQATKRKMELEDRLKRLEMDNLAWKRAAQENEAKVVSLNNTIEQLREKAASCCFNIGVEDAESCCDVDGVEETEQRKRGLVHGDYIEGEEGKAEKMGTAMTMMMCKICNSRNSCILFLPCKHLCSCKACEAFIDSCPVCQTPKKGGIEALMV
ncbi:hypothetical protein K2173_010640 [Erythroxylum novogranatense]|uniref:RING-type domain-containing protein n=1 Tax=Erythroxylum novogranatense TaxID=1862640 RepID=A0AAV8TGK8_9ROSI|nr:hypothetical protein K2173_010640 [Erythroxylum novogranatense]